MDRWRGRRGLATIPAQLPITANTRGFVNLNPAVRGLAALILLVLLIPAPVFGQAAPAVITVRGTAFSGTAGVSLPTGITVTLHQLRVGPGGTVLNLLQQRQTPLSTDGRFIFENIPTQTGDQFFVSAEYEGIQQSSLIREMGEAPADLEFALPLYGLTNDVSKLTVIRARHQLEPRPGNLMQVISGYFIRNLGDRVYRSTDSAPDGRMLSVQIPLPVGAIGIAFPDDLKTALITLGTAALPRIADTRPIFPGEVYRLTVTYLLPYEKAATIDQDYPYGAEAVEILFPTETNLRLTSEKFTFTASLNNEISPPRSFTQHSLTAPLPPAARLIYTLEGDPFAARASSLPSGDSGLALIVVLIGAGAVLVGGVLIVLRRMRRGN